MQYIILNKILPATNQMIYACASGEKVDALLQDDWMFCLTNGEIGYASEGEAWEALSRFKNQKKINLEKAKRKFVKLN